jgi:hypothetical protein
MAQPLGDVCLAAESLGQASRQINESEFVEAKSICWSCLQNLFLQTFRINRHLYIRDHLLTGKLIESLLVTVISAS